MSQNYETNVREISKWVESVGVTWPTTSASILVRSDMEPALLALLKKAMPARVESIPPDPTAMRRWGQLRGRSGFSRSELIACLRHSAQTLGFDYKLDPDSLLFLIRYIATTHKSHHKVRGGEKTPLEIITGSENRSSQTACFGAVVFAETPPSVETPAGTRWIPAAYLGPQYGTRTSLASAIVGDPDYTATKVFLAKAIKCLDRVVFEPKFAPAIIRRLDSDERPKDSAVDVLPPADVGPAHVLPAPMPKTGPPISWIREHGRTPDCYACNHPRGVGHGRVHSSRCKQRYKNWMDEQSKDAPRPVAAPEPSYLPLPSQPSQAGPIPDPQLPFDPADMPESVSYEPSEYVRSESDADMGFSESDEEMMDCSLGSCCLIEDVVSTEGSLSIFESKDQPNLAMPMYLPKIGEPTEFHPYTLTNQQVYLAKPTSVFAETGESKDLKKTEAARLVELDSLNKVGFGRVVNKATAEKYAHENGTRVISTRWVITPKVIDNQDSVRCRLVVQEVAQGSPSAAALGISSSTPSGESLRALLAIAAQENMHVNSLDCGTAFMNAPLPRGQKAVIKLPNDVSSSSHKHKPAYAILHNALNGLRSASLAWLELARKTLRKIGLRSSRTETTIFSGKVPFNGREFKTSVLIDVDDILIVSEGEHVHEIIHKQLLEVVQKVKYTGQIHAQKGGQLVFLGKEIRREPNSRILQLRVAPGYLKELCENLTPTDIPPDIVKDLEKEDSPELENREATRFRSYLGRITWWLQSRPDLARFGSLLAQGQKTPCLKHMNSLMKSLRFLKSQLHLYQCFLSKHLREFSGFDLDRVGSDSLVVFADASWGSQESVQRRSCSGYAVFWRDCLLKACSRLQTSVALSSCESETIVLLQASQEACGLRQLVEFLRSGGEESTDIGGLSQIDLESSALERPAVLLVTDSSSARDVLLGDGLFRRTRHLSIAVYFLQSLMKSQTFKILWAPGILQVGDTLTKILPKVTFHNIRIALGFDEEPWQFKIVKPGQVKMMLMKPLTSEIISLEDAFERAEIFLEKRPRGILMMELRTGPDSGFGNCHLKHMEKAIYFVIQVCKEHDLIKGFSFISKKLQCLKERWKSRPIYCHFSPPCTGGSPAQHMIPQGLAARLKKYWEEFCQLMKSSIPILKFYDLISFELIRHCIYWKSDVVQKFLLAFGLDATSHWHRCAYSEETKVRAKHTYRIQSNFPCIPSQICSCRSHLSFGLQNLKKIGEYAAAMPKEILNHCAKCIFFCVNFMEPTSFLAEQCIDLNSRFLSAFRKKTAAADHSV